MRLCPALGGSIPTAIHQMSLESELLACQARFADGMYAVTTPDGRFTVMMPHVERVARTVTMSWYPDG